MANFGFSELFIVSPKADHLGAGARSRAMHAKQMLRKAKVRGSLDEALKGTDHAVGTTSKVTPAHRLSRTALGAREFAERFAKTDARVALVLGPEASGLKNEDLGLCDFIVEIPTSKRYRAMNLSHAAAVLLYELYIAAGNGGNGFESAPRRVKEQVVKRFGELAAESKGLKNRKATVEVFRRFVSRAPATEREANALLAVFSGLVARLRERKSGKNK